MKQLLQHIRTGEALVTTVPVPKTRAGTLLVGVSASLVSAGTERMVVDFAEKNLLQKARSRPDLVRQTLDKAQREGILTTLEAVQNRLEQPMALGYSCAGTVIEVGDGVEGIEVGDKVACAGGGYAVHAEVVSVPKQLVVKLPDGLDVESAAFTTLGAIALQGIRLAEVKLGEIIAVIGLGLLGQLTVQMLKAAGCVVIGMDIQEQRAELGRQLGADAVTTRADELESISKQLSSGYGVDAVLITADTKSNQPVEVAGQIARKKGIVVAVGAVGMTIPRKVYYEKELDFRISSSYGPGRYDPEYEEQGHDYPYAYVRWTENRNMQAFVQLLASKQVDVQPLITHRFPIDEAPQAYELITGKVGESFLGVLLTYPDKPEMSRKIVLRQPLPTRKILRQTLPFAQGDKSAQKVEGVSLGILGAGTFANATLLPALKRFLVPRNDMPLELVGIASGGGLSARSTGDRFGFAYCTTDSQTIFEDSDINTVAILTRHHLHAPQVMAALEAGKHVFVEKPLCLTSEELQAIVQTYDKVSQDKRFAPLLMVGFNRRFAPYMIELKEQLQGIREPLLLNYRANAGYIPPEHWTQDISQGGGRLLGEACHFIDLLIYLTGSLPERVMTRAMPDSGRYKQDNFVITLEFANGSLGTVTYVANGDKGLGKEFLEVFGGGLSARLDDYRTLTIRKGGKRINRTARLRQDKGHKAEWEAIVAYLTGKGTIPIPFEQIVASTVTTLAAYQSLQSGEAVMMGK